MNKPIGKSCRGSFFVFLVSKRVEKRQVLLIVKSIGYERIE
jgi:hypothetical protein